MPMNMHGILKSGLILIFLLFVNTASAYEKEEISLESGNDISLNRYEDNNDTLLIWLPSEYGISPELVETALNISYEGLDLWTLDLHGSYMLPPGRSSIEKFDIDDIYQLMRIAADKGYKQIILTAAGRGAVLALKAGRQWQLQHPRDHRFTGYIFLHPHLIEGSVEIGDDADYLPIAKSVNKPVYYLQPEYSTKYLRRDQIIEQLESGGAEVKLDILNGITAGFHARKRDELEPEDRSMRQKMGEKFKQAQQFLLAAKQPDAAALLADIENDHKPVPVRMPSLNPYKGNPLPPSLKLRDLNGKPYDLADYRGKVVLINFWASWCGPCVKEIPSLNRLVKKMQGSDFALLTVDIKEPPEKIHEFFKELKIKHEFPVLMDIDGEASKQWKVYAYPSNYLLDKEGQIRYGYRGALEWDQQEVVNVIKSLL